MTLSQVAPGNTLCPVCSMATNRAPGVCLPRDWLIRRLRDRAGGLDDVGNPVWPGGRWCRPRNGRKVASFGQQAPMGRAAHPDEIAPSYVFFASGRLSGYYSGEVLAPIGGETLPG
ncbi:hypothetical protein ACIRL2_45700 [Embleya sp. NPDC127516]|uniref:hypothetical protein n=1 Tax=Embleya sp. NPDC127516 TaxID=3363990 RepID=UPI003809B87F